MIACADLLSFSGFVEQWDNNEFEALQQIGFRDICAVDNIAAIDNCSKR